MNSARRFGIPDSTDRRSGSKMSRPAPGLLGRQSAKKGFWKALVGFVYGVGWLVDWAYWAHDSAWGLLFGWVPALLWPIHLASFALFDWLPPLISP